MPKCNSCPYARFAADKSKKKSSSGAKKSGSAKKSSSKSTSRTCWKRVKCHRAASVFNKEIGKLMKASKLKGKSKAEIKRAFRAAVDEVASRKGSKA